MPKAMEKRNAEFRAGLFIIISLFLLIFSVLWLRYFAIRPYMTVIAKFKDPGPIAKGLQVYYQGVNIGKVSDIDFSKDYKYTLVHISIYRKNLHLPANVVARIDSQGLTGQKFVNIKYPDKPVPELLCDRSSITGEIPFGLSDLQEMLGQQIKNGRIQKMIDNFEQSFEIQVQLSQNMQKLANSATALIEENKTRVSTLIDEGTKTAANLNRMFLNINEIVGDPETKRSIKSTVRSAGYAAAGLCGVLQSDGFSNSLSDIGQITKNIRDITGDKEIKEGLNNTFKLIEETRQTLSGFRSSGVLNKISGACAPSSGTNMIDLAVETMQNTNQAAISVNCLSQGISDILDKRFALLRLMFGKPGASLELCKNIGKLSKEQIDYLSKQGVIDPACSCKTK